MEPLPPADITITLLISAVACLSILRTIVGAIRHETDRHDLLVEVHRIREQRLRERERSMAGD